MKSCEVTSHVLKGEQTLHPEVEQEHTWIRLLSKWYIAKLLQQQVILCNQQLNFFYNPAHRHALLWW